MSVKAEPAIDVGDLKGDEKVLAIADKRLRFCIDSMDRIHRNSLEDLMFYDSQQWPEDILRQRNDDRRPSETINKLPAFASQIINSMRASEPAIKIRAVDNTTDPDTAEVIQGLIRGILHNGNSKSAIDTASFYQVVTGLGYLRILTKYCDDDSFNQDIVVERIDSPHSVYVPIDLINELDFSDMPYAFIRTRISKDDFAEDYPDCDMTSYDLNGVGEDYWIGPDYLYICEYFEKVVERETLYLLSNGETTTDSARVKAAKAEGLTVDKEREVDNCKIMWRKITLHDVLDEKEFPGSYIPVIPFIGQQINVNGEKRFIGMVRNAKSPQRMYNYFFNAAIETIALAPRAPFIMAQAQVEGYEEVWATANSKNNAYLPYHPVTVDSVGIPPPQRVAPPEAGASLFAGISLASEQLKEVTGIYDASLGQHGSETSGKAILARQKQGSIGSFHYSDNQAMAISHLGRILVDIIPDVYDTARAVRILGEDETEKVVTINKMHPDSDEPGKLYDLTVGKYDVVVDVGPNYETKRMETAENLMNIMQSNPNAATPIMDLLYRNLDFTYAQEAGDRMKYLIKQQFPGIIQEETNEGGRPTEQQVQAMVADMQKLMQAHQLTMQENAQMGQMINQLQAALKSKAEENQIKIDTAVIKAQAEVQKAAMGAQQQQQSLQADLFMHHTNRIDKAQQMQQAQEMKSIPGNPKRVPVETE
jgi:hypothetical protein